MTSSITARAIDQEIVRRARAREKRKAEYEPTPRELDLAEKIKALWFPEQRAFFTSKARRRVAFCTRRAGKTIGTAIWFLVSMLENPTSLHLYIAQTASISKLYLWPELQRLIHEFDLPFEVNQNDLVIRHKRGLGSLTLKGADNAKQIENLRGPHWKKVALDEASLFGAYIEELVMEVLGAALRDTNGELILTGTAGKHKRGLFYEACHELRRRKSDGRPVYELHRWSLQDNPHLPPDAKNEDLIIDDEGFSGVDDPRFLREFRGVWAVGDSERMFAGFSEERNVYEGDLPPNHQWRFLLGCDFGWHDESAMCVVAWARTHPCIYIPEIWGKSRLYTDEIAARMLELKGKYGLYSFVGDTGGYGKNVVVHLQRDYQICVNQAQKKEKLDHIGFINSAFQRGDVKIHKHNAKRLVVQLHEVCWNESKTNAGNHERDDLAFAMVYGWREAKSSGAGRDVRNIEAEVDTEKQKLYKEKLDALRDTEKDASISDFAASVSGSANNYRGVSKQWRQMLGHR